MRGKEKRFRNNVTWMSFLLTLLVIWTHALNAELFLGEGWEQSAAGQAEKLLGVHLAQIAVPGFFMVSGLLFFRNYRLKDTLRKWQRRARSLLIPYFLWNALYYLGYLLASRLPLLKEIAGTGPVPLNLETALKAVFLYQYNTVFWFVFQLLLLTMLSPVIFLVIRQRWSYLAVSLVLCVLILLRVDPTPLNSDALLYYMTAGRVGILLFREETDSRRMQANPRMTTAPKMEKGQRITYIPGKAGVAAAAALFGLLLYGAALFSGNDLPLVLSRLAAAAALWILLLTLPLPDPAPVMHETFLIYAIHFGPVRLINKCAAIPLQGSGTAALLLFLLMPVLILVLAGAAARFGNRFVPRIFHLFTGNRG